VHPWAGMNSRLDELQAALLTERLKWLPSFTQRRREVAALYRDHLRNAAVVTLAPAGQAEAHVHHLFVLRCTARSALQAHLQAQGVQALIHYPVPVHMQQPCLSFAHDPQGLARSQAHADQCLSIPCHPQLSNADVQHVIDSVNSFA
jgi:dTDP-4-amino-4,6-dideoxygalactose transaminase